MRVYVCMTVDYCIYKRRKNGSFRRSLTLSRVFVSLLQSQRKKKSEGERMGGDDDERMTQTSKAMVEN